MSSAWLLFGALLLLSASVSAFYVFLQYRAEQRRIEEERIDSLRRWKIFVDGTERKTGRGVTYGLVLANILEDYTIVAISQPLGCDPCGCGEGSQKHCTCGSREHQHHHHKER